MTPWSRLLVEQWRIAETAARVAERTLFDAAMAFTAGAGPIPPDAQWEASKRLRAVANEMFNKVVAVASGVAIDAPAGSTGPEDGSVPAESPGPAPESTGPSAAAAFARWGIPDGNCFTAPLAKKARHEPPTAASE